MSWTETSSLSFTARHDAGHGDAAVSVLESLEQHRAKLEQLFPHVPGNVTVVLHDSPLQLALAQPYLPLARLLAAPAARRYMAGWFTRDEVHVLSPAILRSRAGGTGSLEALMLSPERVYTLLIVGLNNALLPPPFRPSSVYRGLRLSWLPEGAAQHFSGQVPYLRLPISRRLRDGPATFPPGPRDAPLLAGAVFDLLEKERGASACVELARGDHAGSGRDILEAAFESNVHEVARRWREHLERLAQAAPKETADRRSAT